MNKDSLAKLRSRMEPRWDEQRTGRVRAALHARSRRQRVVRAGLALGALGLFLASVVVVRMRGLGLRHSGNVEVATVQALSAAVTLLSADSVLTPDADAGGRAYTLKKGGARFVVAHDATRPFRVHVAALLIEDLGTVFSVQLGQNGSTEVAVEEGRVRVVAANQTSELTAGERRTFAGLGASGVVAPDAAPADSASDADSGSNPNTDAGAPAKRAAVPAWRPLAENGQYREAYESLRQAGRAGVRDDVGELLLAADAARLSGHPADAVPYLEQAVHSHASDPRASLAYFTLGRVLLDELGRPSEAASAFEHARKGQLAEDALAREVEAYSRAGDVTRARSLALDYQRLYPQGRRTRAVTKFGGLE